MSENKNIFGRFLIVVIVLVIVIVLVGAILFFYNKKLSTEPQISQDVIVFDEETIGDGVIVKSIDTIDFKFGDADVSLTKSGGISDNEILSNIEKFGRNNIELPGLIFTDDSPLFLEENFGSSTLTKVYDINASFDFRNVVVYDFDMQNMNSEEINNIAIQKSQRIAQVYFKSNFPAASEMSISDLNIEVAVRDILSYIPQAMLGNAVFYLEGNTDTANSRDFSQKLSERRAEYIKDVLVEKFGMNHQSVFIKGNAFDNLASLPDDINHPNNQALNRRVDIKTVFFETMPSAVSVKSVYKIKHGDTLKKIAFMFYNDEARAMVIYKANPNLRVNKLIKTQKYKDWEKRPWDLIFPDEEITIPRE